MKLRIGSRESALAVAQAQILLRHLAAAGIDAELVTMKTTGDVILDRALDKVGGKGLFIKELEKALLDGAIDLAVHSYKDMPMQIDPRLPIVAVSPRSDPRDALVLPLGVSSIDPAKPIGSGSKRRTIQLEALYPDMEVAPIRGNVLTRLDKLDAGAYAALVLAAAGLKRLGLSARASRVFEPREMIPAACQGILALQARRDFDTELLAGFHDADAWDMAEAERGFVETLDGGCSSPIGAYATLDGDQLTLTGLYVNADGQRRTGTLSSTRREARKTGRLLAVTLSEGGMR